MVGTSWISKKGGILEKGGWPRNGDYEPTSPYPYQLWQNSSQTVQKYNKVKLEMYAVKKNKIFIVELIFVTSLRMHLQ